MCSSTRYTSSPPSTTVAKAEASAEKLIEIRGRQAPFYIKKWRRDDERMAAEQEAR